MTPTLDEVQRARCSRHGALFSPPQPEQLCAVSDGVYEGDPVQGVRYHAPPHMSGWYLTTDRYDGDHTTLRVEHVAHVVEQRPDVAEFLALPPGYRFETRPDVADAWYDPAVPEAESD